MLRLSGVEMRISGGRRNIFRRSSAGVSPLLTETRIYIDPEPWGRSVGHSFSRRVDRETLERVDSPSQIDSWNRTWTFFDWNLRPYQTEPVPREHAAR